jgi:hypothetical protein
MTYFFQTATTTFERNGHYLEMSFSSDTVDSPMPQVDRFERTVQRPNRARISTDEAVDSDMIADSQLVPCEYPAVEQSSNRQSFDDTIAHMSPGARPVLPGDPAVSAGEADQQNEDEPREICNSPSMMDEKRVSPATGNVAECMQPTKADKSDSLTAEFDTITPSCDEIVVSAVCSTTATAAAYNHPVGMLFICKVLA